MILRLLIEFIKIKFVILKHLDKNVPLIVKYYLNLLPSIFFHEIGLSLFEKTVFFSISMKGKKMQEKNETPDTSKPQSFERIYQID